MASPSGPAGGACGSIRRARRIAEVGCCNECAPGIWLSPPNRSHHTLGFSCCCRRRPAMNRVVVVSLLALLPLEWASAQDVGTVAGAVTDKMTGAALVGAEVSIGAEQRSEAHTPALHAQPNLLGRLLLRAKITVAPCLR